MSEPSGEYSPRLDLGELDPYGWVRNGAIEIYYPKRENETYFKKGNFLAKSLISGKIAPIRTTEYVLLTILDPDIPKSKDRICEEYPRRLKFTYSNLGIKREVNDINYNILNVMLHNIQMKLGSDFIEFTGGYSNVLKLKDFPLKAK